MEFDLFDYIKFRTFSDSKHKDNLFVPVEQLNGEKWKTPLIYEFDQVDQDGELNQIAKFFNGNFDKFKDDTEVLTELSIVCNLRYWYWKDKNEEFSLQYAKQYVKTRQYVMDNWNDKQLEYYWKMTD